MNVEGLITAIVGGVVSLSILSVVLDPHGAAAAVIGATSTGFGSLLTAAKTYPK